jgi:hypothetical protein
VAKGVIPLERAFTLTKAGPSLIAAPNEKRRYHFDRSPPPCHRGTGGRLRLRFRPCRRILPAAFLLPE